LEPSDCIVTTDAMGCQTKITKEIIEADADYVLALKGNHEKVHEEIKTFLDDTVAQTQQKRPAGAEVPKAMETLASLETVDKDHGRYEIRRFYQSQELGWFADKDKWEGLKTAGMVESIREINGQSSIERRYFLSSLAVDIETFARAVRSHWRVENKVHWIMDVSFREDQSRARTGFAAENLANYVGLRSTCSKRRKPKSRIAFGRDGRHPRPSPSNSAHGAAGWSSGPKMAGTPSHIRWRGRADYVCQRRGHRCSDAKRGIGRSQRQAIRRHCQDTPSLFGLRFYPAQDR
jgi:predicted transposase YbfD/YdcC